MELNMQIYDDREKREQIANSLEATWELLEELKLYIDPTLEADNKRPQFEEVALQLLPDAKEQLSRLSLSQLEEVSKSCQLCPLAKQRKNVVFGEGSGNAKLMVIGEAPGAQEDEEGRPFVGNSGQYLTSWLKAINLDREKSIYITNIVKCRPPGNRDPHESEAEKCLSYLRQQIALIKPDLILCLGRVATHYLLNTSASLSSMRMKIHRFETISTIVTYHPSAVLRNLSLRKEVWDDLRLVAKFLNLPAGNR
ncbi:MAG: uracil-DNA glycosylase [Sphaerochaetaceae bacterium]|jgi:DNA polymerase